jgi:hypothetical protein
MGGNGLHWFGWWGRELERERERERYATTSFTKKESTWSTERERCMDKKMHSSGGCAFKIACEEERIG